MNKKALLSLLAASAVGCVSSGGRYVTDPYKATENEKEIYWNVYENERENLCMRTFYLETETRKHNSFLVTEHCVSHRGEGYFYSLRFKDDNTDGIVNEVCAQSGETYTGGLDLGSKDCWKVLRKPLVNAAASFVSASSGKDPTPVFETYLGLFPD